MNELKRGQQSRSFRKEIMDAGLEIWKAQTGQGKVQATYRGQPQMISNDPINIDQRDESLFARPNSFGLENH